MARLVWALALTRKPARARRRLGRMAVRAHTCPAAERRAAIEARLGTPGCPRGSAAHHAVDADTGELHGLPTPAAAWTWSRHGASCAMPGVWPPVTINGRRWIDGGTRSAANADLAAGYDRVVVVAPITRGLRSIPSVPDQVMELSRGCQAVALVAPDAAAVAAFGRNLLDPRTRAPSARAGYAQAAAVLAGVAAVWG